MRRWIVRILIVAVAVSSPVWISAAVWRVRPPVDRAVVVVDYTSRPDNVQSHAGLTWVLNHHRVGRRTWDAWTDFVGYRLDELALSTRLQELDPATYDWAILTDSYGVYEHDLLPADERGPLRGPTPLVFGGLSEGDLAALEALVARDGDVFVEFNVLAPPTDDAVRGGAEALLGVRWTGWVGRFFADLHDETDLPYWFDDLYAASYGDRPVPDGPCLMLVGSGGPMVLVSAETIEAVVPIVTMTPDGRRRFGLREAPFYGWFTVVRPTAGSVVHAELRLPVDLPDGAGLRAAGIDERLPLLVEHRVGESGRWFLAANISNIDFDPGEYRVAGMPWVQALLHRRRDEVRKHPAYWQFYVPVVGRILREES